MLERGRRVIEFNASEVFRFNPEDNTAVEQLLIGSQPHDEFMRGHFMTPQRLMNFDWEAEDAEEKIQKVIENRRRQGAIASNTAAIDLLGTDFAQGAVLYSLPDIDPEKLETLYLPRLCGLYIPIDDDRGNITIDESEMSKLGITDVDARRYMMERLIKWSNVKMPHFHN